MPSKKSLPQASIRIMGDKKLADKVLGIILKALEQHGLDFTAPRSYPMYKDKKKRKEVDPTRTRIYLNVYGLASVEES